METLGILGLVLCLGGFAYGLCGIVREAMKR